MNGVQPQSKITGGKVEPLFMARVLKEFDVQYYRCIDTGFIQTEEPYWLKEAYATPIHPLDVGLVSRNIRMAKLASTIIDRLFGFGGRFLDYGGGTGLFVRLMRDAGFDFLRTDPFCENTFSAFFDVDDAAQDVPTNFELLTAFEVFEHLPDPHSALEQMFNLSETILFSTELQPRNDWKTADDWWYFIPEEGQHIAFYTIPALEFLAKRWGAALYSDGARLHMLTRNKALSDPFLSKPSGGERRRSIIQRIARKLTRQWYGEAPGSVPQRQSLTQADFEFVRSRFQPAANPKRP